MHAIFFFNTKNPKKKKIIPSSNLNHWSMKRVCLTENVDGISNAISTLGKTKKTERNVSVEMKLVILLLGLPVALGYVENYKGFNNCGEDGWTCESIKGKFEITFTCPPSQPNARVWVWTARLPMGSTTFTVKNCKHLEVHMDCPKGLRTTILRQFNVVNVQNLDILPPIFPGVFLHDNDQIPQAPPILHIENVETTKFYPGLFDKPGGGCRYKYVELSSLTLVNVTLDKLSKGLFHNQNLDKIVMKDVVLNGIESNAMTLNGDVSISGTTFPFLPNNAIQIKGENISFINNTFQKIQTLALIIRSKNFKFTDNKVEEVNTQGLDVLGAKIEITDNIFHYLETRAFEKITPGYSPVTYELASKFVYNFSGNVVKNINPGSLHINWEVFKKVCSEIIFSNNEFDCSCVNFGWFSLSNGLGQKLSKAKDFYQEYLNRDGNTCTQYKHCPLKTVIAQIHDVCNNKINVSTICESFANVTDPDTTVTTSEDLTSLIYSTQETKEPKEHEITFLQPLELTEKAIPVLSYTENQTLHMNERNIPIWFIVVPVIVVLVAICLGTFMWWYKKTRERQDEQILYRNERGPDADSLVVISEHHNQLYYRQ